MSLLTYVHNLAMFRFIKVILDVYPPTSKLVASQVVMVRQIFNDLGWCKVKDSEVLAIFQMKWPNLNLLYLCKYVLNQNIIA